MHTEFAAPTRTATARAHKADAKFFEWSLVGRGEEDHPCPRCGTIGEHHMGWQQQTAARTYRTKMKCWLCEQRWIRVDVRADDETPHSS